jgi:hypothetical protein
MSLLPTKYLLPLCPLALLCLSSCSGVDETSLTDTSADTATDTATDTGVDVVFSLVLKDFMNNQPVENATVRVGSDEYTTSASGGAALTVKGNSYIVVDVEAEGYLPAHLHRFVGPNDRSAVRKLPTYEARDLIGTLFGLTPDTTKGALAVNIGSGDPRQDTDSDWLEETEVNIDLDYTTAMVVDPSATYGLSLGNTTLIGADASVLFVNVDVGTVTLSISPPDGYTCELIPSPVEITADHYHEVTVYCQST